MKTIGLGLNVTKLAGVDLARTLDYDFRLSETGTLLQARRRGPVLSLARASTGYAFNSSGVLSQLAVDVPRFDHDPVNSNASLGLLFEEARINHALQSEGVAAPWMKFGALSISINNDPAPDGTMTADRIVDISTGAFQALQQDISISTALLPWIWSVYCNKQAFDTFPEFQFIMSGGVGITATAQLDLQTGATAIRVDPAGAGLTIAVEELANHWRYSMTMTNTGGNNVVQIGILPAASNSTLGALNSNAVGGVGVWGHQLEQASFATSYIPTTTASVTRAKDVCKTTDVSWFNETQGTLVIEADHYSVDNFSPDHIVTINDGGSSNEISIQGGGGALLESLLIKVAGADEAKIEPSQTLSDNTLFKAAGAYAENDVAGCVNAGVVTTDTLVTLPSGITTMDIGGGGISTPGRVWNGHIKRIKYYNQRMSNSFLISATA